jgi:hypothetical protein
VHALRPDELALQLSLLINSAFVSTQIFSVDEASGVLLVTKRTMIAAALSPKVMQ